MVHRHLDQFEQIAASESESDVVSILLEAASALGFERVRYHDATVCPFDGATLSVLRESLGGNERLKPGYKIYNPELNYAGDGLPKPRVERWTNDDDYCDEKLIWLKHLGMPGRTWVDMPIVDQGRPVGLWSMDLRSAKDAISDSLLGEIRMLGITAGLKLSELRLLAVESAVEESVTEPPSPKIGNGYIDLLLLGISRLVGCAEITFYSYDSYSGTLRVIADVFNRPNRTDDATSQPDGEVYEIGSFLTGLAWADKSFRYVPDFSKLVRRRPDLVREDTHSARTERLGAAIQSIVYQKIAIAGGAPGMLRIINRAASSDLMFTQTHRVMLEQLGRLFADQMAVYFAASHVVEVGKALSNTISSLRESKADYSVIRDAAKSLGAGGMMVIRWNHDGTFRSIWGEDSSHTVRARAYLSRTKFENLEVDSPKLITADKLPNAWRQFLHSVDIDTMFVVPKLSDPQDFSGSEDFLAVFLLAKHRERSTTDRRVPSKKYWKSRNNLLQMMELLGWFAGTVDEISRNRTLLKNAERAIGIIGHELRSPSQGLVNLAENLVLLEKAMLAHLDDSGARKCSLLHIDQHGVARSRQVSSKLELSQHLHWTHQNITTYSRILRRTIDDAIQWARMRTNKVEVMFARVTLMEHVRQCLQELRDDVRRKPYIKIVVQPSISALPEIVADPDLLYRLLFNLLDNAVKYSHSAGSDRKHESNVTVAGTSTDDYIEVKVTNWGLGIPEADYEHVFSGFYRTRVRDQLHTVRGVGLGLPTCRRIVKIHRGNIAVTSQQTLDDPVRREKMEGCLTTFTVRLPRALPVGRRDIPVSVFGTDSGHD